MIKRWVPNGRSPEGRTYFKEVEVPVLKKGEQPEPPPNFTLEERGRTSDKPRRSIFTQAQAIGEALDDKDD